MVIARRHRRWLSVWLVIGLLFSQLAVAGYVCPARAATPDAAAHGMPGCEGMSAAPWATPMDPDQPQLCKAHCEQGSQAVDGDRLRAFDAAPVLVATLDWRPVALLVRVPDPDALRVPMATPPPGAPPLYLSLLVLRN
jgi:hypothetical protein